MCNLTKTAIVVPIIAVFVGISSCEKINIAVQLVDMEVQTTTGNERIGKLKLKCNIALEPTTGASQRK